MNLTNIPAEELLKIASALENGFYFKSGYAPSDEKPEFWAPRTFFLKYEKYYGWCFAKITGGHTYNKNEYNLGFEFDYVIVNVSSSSWALTKEELQ